MFLRTNLYVKDTLLIPLIEKFSLSLPVDWEYNCCGISSFLYMLLEWIQFGLFAWLIDYVAVYSIISHPWNQCLWKRELTVVSFCRNHWRVLNHWQHSGHLIAQGVRWYMLLAVKACYLLFLLNRKHQNGGLVLSHECLSLKKQIICAPLLSSFLHPLSWQYMSPVPVDKALFLWSLKINCSKYISIQILTPDSNNELYHGIRWC